MKHGATKTWKVGCILIAVFFLCCAIALRAQPVRADGVTTPDSTITLGGNPVGVAIADTPSAGEYAFITGSGFSSGYPVAVIDTSTQSIYAYINSEGIAGYGAAVTPDGQYFYNSDPGSSYVSEINTPPYLSPPPVPAFETYINLGSSGVPDYSADPAGIAMVTYGGSTYAFVADSGYTTFPLPVATPGQTYYVSVIDTTASTPYLVGVIAVGSEPTGVAASLDGQYVYVTNTGDNSISQIDVDTCISDLTASIAYAPTLLNTYAPLIEPTSIAVSPYNGDLIVTNEGSNYVSIINPNPNLPSDYTSIGVGPAGAAPTGIAIGPEIYGTYFAFVTSSGVNSVYVINLNDAVVQSRITDPSLNDPTGIAYAPQAQLVYVANSGDGTVSVINPSNAVLFSINGITTQIEGVPFLVTINAADAYGYTATDYTGTLSLSVNVNDGINNGVITPSSIGTGWVDGVWTGYVTVDSAGSDQITAIDSTNSPLNTEYSNTFTVNTVSAVLGQLATIEVSASSTTVTAGSSVTFSAEGYDSQMEDLGPVTSLVDWSISTGAGGSWDQTTGAYTSYTASAPGVPWTVTATDAANPAISGTASLTVNAASASTLVFSSGTGQTMAATEVSPNPIIVTLEDPYGNFATSTSDTVVSLSTTSTSSANGLGGQFLYYGSAGPVIISSITIPAGQSSSDVYYMDYVVGNPRLTAATVLSGTLVSASTTFTITPAPASQLAFIGGTGQTLAAGDISNAITVQLQDLFGNPATASTPLTVDLFTSSTGGAFYSSDSTSSTQIYSITITPGLTSASFYYSDSVVSTSTDLYAQIVSFFSPAETVFTITPPTASSTANSGTGTSVDISQPETGVETVISGLASDTSVTVTSISYGTVQPSGTSPSETNGIFYDIQVTSQPINALAGLTVTVYLTGTFPGGSTVYYLMSGVWMTVTTTTPFPGGVYFYVPASDLTGTPIMVNVPPTVAISPGTATLDVNQPQLFTATPSGGTGTYTGYQWYVDGSPQTGQTASTFSYSPPSTGSYSITATVTDTNGLTSLPSNAATVAADPALTVSEPSTLTVDVGQSVTYSASVSGGSGSYSYTWFMKSVQVGTSSTYSYTALPSDYPAGFTISVTVTDTGTSSPYAVPSKTETVTVNQLTITVTQTANGVISPPGTTGTVNVNYGATPSFIITPNTGYQIASITANGVSVPVTSPASQTYQFSHVYADGSLTATFTPITTTHSVTFTESGLPSGTYWWVTFNGATESSTKTTITFSNIASGSYSWKVSTPLLWLIVSQYAASPSSGIISVPSQTAQTITYTPQYLVSVLANPISANGGTFKVTYTMTGTTYTDQLQSTPWLQYVDANTIVTVSSPQSPYIDCFGYSFTFGSYTNNAVTMNLPQMITLNYYGALDHFVFSCINSPQTAGTPFQITITAEDAYGDPVLNYGGTAALTETGSGLGGACGGLGGACGGLGGACGGLGGACGGLGGAVSPSSVTFTKGVYTGLVYVTKAGTWDTITATSGTTSSTSNPFNVDPGALYQFVFSTIGGTQTSGKAFTVTITAEDQWGNTVTSFSGTETLAVTSGTITSPATVTFRNGVASDVSVTIKLTPVSSVQLYIVGYQNKQYSNPFTV